MAPETKQLVSDKVFNGMTVIMAPKGFGAILHFVEFKWKHDGTVKEGIGVNDAALLAKWPGMLYDNERDYIGWGFWAARR